LSTGTLGEVIGGPVDQGSRFSLLVKRGRIKSCLKRGAEKRGGKRTRGTDEKGCELTHIKKPALKAATT